MTAATALVPRTSTTHALFLSCATARSGKTTSTGPLATSRSTFPANPTSCDTKPPTTCLCALGTQTSWWRKWPHASSKWKCGLVCPTACFPACNFELLLDVGAKCQQVAWVGVVRVTTSDVDPLCFVCCRYDLNHVFTLIPADGVKVADAKSLFPVPCTVQQALSMYVICICGLDVVLRCTLRFVLRFFVW